MTTHPLTTLDPADATVRSDAKHLADRLSGHTPVEAAVRAMLDDVAHGTRVVVLRAEDEVTPAQAADILGVTRQFVDRLCADGALAFRRLPGSRHRRIRVQDAIDIAAERERLRKGARARLHGCWEVFADSFPPAGAFLAGDAPGALDLLASVVSRWSGARAYLRAQRPAFAELLERIDAHPPLARVFRRHWPD